VISPDHGHARLSGVGGEWPRTINAISLALTEYEEIGLKARTLQREKEVVHEALRDVRTLLGWIPRPLAFCQGTAHRRPQAVGPLYARLARVNEWWKGAIRQGPVFRRWSSAAAGRFAYFEADRPARSAVRRAMTRTHLPALLETKPFER